MDIDYFKDGKVISLNPLRRKARFPAVGQVEAYWEGLRNGRPMPARAEVDPRGITDALAYAFVLEKIAPGMARLRVAGRHLSELMGMEVRGMPFSTLFLPEARSRLQEAMETAFTAPASLRLSLAGDTGFTRPPLEARLFFAPLRDEQGRPTRLLGALQSSGRIGRAPRRFAIREIEVNRLLGEPGQAAPLARRATRGLEHQDASRPAVARRPRKPRLELVYSADS